MRVLDKASKLWYTCCKRKYTGKHLGKGQANTMKLYLIQQKGSNYFKIGISNNIKRRLANLQSGNPNKLYVVRYWDIPKEARKIESLLHCLFAEYHVHLEWFQVEDVTLLLEGINQALALKGIVI